MIKTKDHDQPPTTAPLYGQLLGEDAAGLHGDVAALHCGRGDVEATGRLHVRRGTSPVGRFLGAILGLPSPGGDVASSLWITRREGAERWVRVFDDSAPLISRQQAGPDGTLLETFGPVRLTFRLEVDAGALRFQQHDCHLVVGAVSLPVPTWVAPRVEALARPSHDGDVAVSVRVAGPITGLLLAYEGTMTVEERRG